MQLHLVNFGILLHAHDRSVETELLSLYKQAIAANILLYDGRITHSSFFNIVSLANLCREFEWAEWFIETYSPHLEENIRQAALAMGKSTNYFHQGRLDEAQAALTADVFTIPIFDLLARGLLVRISFENFLRNRENYDFLTSYLKAFEKYVQTRPLTEEKKAAQLNLIRQIRKMALLKFTSAVVPEAKKQELRKRLQQLRPVVFRKWLEQMIERL